MKRYHLLYTLIALFVLCLALLFYPDYDSPRIVKFLIVSQVLFVLSLAIYWVGRAFDFETRHRRLFYGVLILALLARLVMWYGAGDKFYLSDDIYRYVWDGKVSAHGINPFYYSPPALELKSLRDSTIYPNINHPWLPTIYPPMAQNVFLVAYTLGGDTTWSFKVICLVFELLTVITLLVWLRVMDVKRVNMLLYLFSPLILIEFYISAHLDILAMPFFVAALVTLKSKRAGMTGMMLALASLVKFYGLFFAPILFFHFKGKDKLRFFASFTLTFVMSYLPYVFGSEGRFLGSLTDYLKDWQYNPSVFLVLKHLFSFESARYIVGGMFLAWLVYLIIAKVDIHSKLFRVFGGYLILTPTFFPWYFVWIFPFILRNLSVAFLFLSGTALLSYHVLIGYYATGTWTPVIWLGIASYGPFYALLIWTSVRRRVKR